MLTPHRSAGFTLVELVSVIVLLGILSVGVASRVVNKDSFSEYALRERIIASLRVAQQAAMHDHRSNVCYRYFSDSGVNGFGAQISIDSGANYNYLGVTALTDLDDDANARDFAGITFSANTIIYFNQLGEASASCNGASFSSPATISIAGGSGVSVDITVHPSGYVQRS